MTTQKNEFAQSIKELEEINTWFQNEDIDLDEGLRKLKRGRELIKACRARLKDVENEFLEIKEDFEAEDRKLDAVSEDLKSGTDDDIPF